MKIYKPYNKKYFLTSLAISTIIYYIEMRRISNGIISRNTRIRRLRGNPRNLLSLGRKWAIDFI